MSATPEDETWEQEFEREAREQYRRTMGYDRPLRERALAARAHFAAGETLTDFLLVRLAEDEHTARHEPEHSLGGSPALGWVDVGPGDALLIHPTRVLTECFAAREIVLAAERNDEPSEMHLSALTLEWVVKRLALPYADHPDYRDEWRP